jgi:hypothetical protein
VKGSRLRHGDEREKQIAAVIVRVHLDLLGHEPDEDGRRNYRRLIFEREWGETGLRDAISRSPEYLNRKPPAPHRDKRDETDNSESKPRDH